MAKKGKTIFQALDKAITGNWNPQDTAMPHINSYDMSDKAKDVLYRTNDKEEYLNKKLELQQNKYLKDRWVKANVNLSVTAYAGLNNVKLMYRDADLMDAFPEIGAALDTYAEEASIAGSDGNIVNVYSKSDRIKSILQDLFINRLNVQLTAPMIIRAMCKYGNQFMLLDIDNKNGVKGWKQMPVFNVERIENGIQNPYGMGMSIAVNGITRDDADMSTQFVWLDDNNSQIPFRDWQIAHFRLLTNSLYLPYGVSALNAARRHWRMLSLMEDMMLIYRLERSVERRVYKIFVGAIDDADVQAYVEQIANQFKRTPIIDPMTGQIDLRKNILPVHKDTPIPLLDGRTITIENLAKEFESGKENYVYSIQDKTHKIVPGKVVWCGKNYTAEKLYKIVLDDDSYMVLASEHEIIMRDGSKKRADEVSIGESVMPLYRDMHKISSEYDHQYERVYNPSTGRYQFTHRLIAESLPKNKESNNTIHHKDFNGLNNSPLNLQWMDWDEHRDYHVALNSSDRTRESRRITSSERWFNGDFRKNAVKKMTISFDDYVWSSIDDAIKEGVIYSQKTMLEFINNNLIDYLSSINNCKRLKKNNRISKPTINVRLNEIGYANCDDYLASKEKEFGLPSRFDILNKEKSERSKKYGLIKNLGVRWENTDKADEIKAKIAASNRRRYENGAYEKIAKKNSLKFDELIWNSLREAILKKKITHATELYKYVNTELISHILEITESKMLKENKKVSKKAILRRIKEEYGFKSTNEYIESMKKNHKIKNIEIVRGDDVYCMTVVGLNGEEDRHNFALTTWKTDGSLNESGVFVSNCIDNDVFLPVRDENAPTPIDTLSAGQNLTAMDDIKFVQNKVLTALRIPKSFLNFEENAGDGKNLALMDIRFTRLINRIQQAFLMELTKVASIHLFLLGFNDELNNFTLSMNNPSTQAEGLEIENMQKKIDAVRDAVSDPGNGLPVMSQTRALKQIMKWSEKEIKENLEEIRLEKGIAAELEKTTQIIKKTGIFDTVDRIYGEPGAEYQDDMQGQGGMGADGGMGGGGAAPPPPPMGGEGDMGGDLGGLGAPGDDGSGGDIAGAEGSMPTQDMGTDPNAPMESVNSNKPLIYESSYKRADIYDSESLLINEEFDKMIKALNKFVENE